MLLITLDVLSTRCGPGSLSRPGCVDVDRIIGFEINISSGWWPLIFLAACLVFLVSLTVLPMRRSRTSGRVLNAMLAAVVGWGIFALCITFAQSVWWPSIGSIVVAAQFLDIAPQPVPQVHVLVAILALLVLTVFVSRHRGVRSACNVLVWCSVGSLLLFAFAMTNPDIDSLLFSSQFYGEGGRLIRDFLLAFVAAYTCLWFVLSRGSSGYETDDEPGRFERGMRATQVALLAALASACIIYVVESVVPYDENISRFVAAIGYGRDDYGKRHMGPFATVVRLRSGGLRRHGRGSLGLLPNPAYSGKRGCPWSGGGTVHMSDYRCLPLPRRAVP